MVVHVCGEEIQDGGIDGDDVEIRALLSYHEA